MCNKYVRCLVFLVSLIGLSAGADASDVPADFCAIVRNPEIYSDKLVLLAGRIESDGLEHTVIKNRSCPKNGVGISYSDRASSSKEARRIQEAILAPPLAGTRNKVIDATVLGVLKWNPNDPSIYSRIVVVDRITRLHVKIKIAEVAD